MNDEPTFEELKNQITDLKRQYEFLRLNSTFENGEKEKRAAELIIANKELDFQNGEKDKRAEELIIANKTIDFQSELIIAKEKVEESEIKLRISENDFKRAQSIAHIGHWKWYLKTNEVEWSDEMFNIFGIDKNSYRGRLGDIIAKVIHPDDLHIVLPSNANEFSEKKPMEYRIILHDKSIRYIWAVAGETKFDENGKTTFLNGIAQDITERKQIEQALKESEEKLRLIFENTSEAILFTEPDGKINFVNNEAIKIFGYTNEEFQLIGRNGIIDKDDKRFVLALEERKRNGIFKGELNYKRKDGSIFPSETTSNIFTNSKGYIISSIIIKDISERKQVEKIIQLQNEELTKLNSDKDRFITILAHDLISPFNTILGFLDLLKSNIRIYDIEKVEQHINIINNSAQNTFKLLEDILFWVLANSGKIPFEPQKLNFTTVCAEVIENLKLNATNKNITINVFALDVHILADKNMLNTILRNLISNAIKFTKNGGQIDINAETNHTYVTITVSDNGTGIKPEILPKLFDISCKLTTMGTENEKGTGLGLLLCKEFAEKHGGQIWVESELGKGSDFKFSLPL
jgi:PAS domain S-box-containing protein